MIETVALAAVGGYLVLGVAARVFVPITSYAEGTKADPMDLVNDELMSLMAWAVATIVAAIALLLLGSAPLDVVIAAVFVMIVGGLGYCVLHYVVWGAHLLSIGANAGVFGEAWFWLVVFVIPVVQAVSLMFLTTPRIASLDDGLTAALAAVLAATAVISRLVSILRGARCRAGWLRAADAAAASDPEIAAELLARGWRPDGRYDEMTAVWVNALGKVNSARRRAGVAIFEGPNQCY